MRWWMIVVSAVAVTASVAAVVWALSRASDRGELTRIESALQLQTNCAHTVVQRPSRDRAASAWAGSTVQTADVRCAATGDAVVYARFGDHAALERALAVNPPAGRYCPLSDAIVLDRLVSAPSTAMSDICQSLGGTLLVGSVQ